MRKVVEEDTSAFTRDCRLFMRREDKGKPVEIKSSAMLTKFFKG
jgi:hypothetical protein